AVLVGLVVDPGNPLDLLLGCELRDGFDQVLLVHLIWDLGDDDLRTAAGLSLLDLGPGSHDYSALTVLIRFFDALPSVDVRAGREIRALDDLPELGNAGFRVVDQEMDALDDLSEVVGRDVGGHTDSDTPRAVHQQVRNLGR